MTTPVGPDGIDLDHWQPWRPPELAARLAGFAAPWWVCGGWAIDLFLGVQTREHEDIEFAVCRPDFPAVRDILAAGHDLYCAGDGRLTPLAPGALPPADCTQVWTRDRTTGAFRTDTFLDPGSHDEWICKRDPAVWLPLAAAVGVTAAGIPYLRPQVMLLMKAKGQRAKDEADRVRVWPELDESARRWFLDTLAVVHPGHDWLTPPRTVGTLGRTTLGGAMQDRDVLGEIHSLVEEEHQLRRQGDGSEEERARLAAIEAQLDQCWDLLRRRRAREDAGQDPNAERARPRSEVESYLQ